MALPFGVSSKLSHPAVRYAVAGVVSFVADFGLLTICYTGLSLPLWLATTVGFWGSYIVNFLLNKHFAFQVAHRTGQQLFRYSVLVASNYVITLGIVDVAQRIGIGYLLGKTIAVVLLTMSTYLLYRKWVFAHDDKHAEYPVMHTTEA